MTCTEAMEALEKIKRDLLCEEHACGAIGEAHYFQGLAQIDLAIQSFALATYWRMRDR